MSEEKKNNLSKREIKSIEDLLKNIVDSEIRVASEKLENDKLKKLMIETMEAFDLASYEMVTQVKGEDLCNVTRVTLVKGNSIVYDSVKLEEALGKERSKLYINKKYTLVEIDDFKALLKEYGVPNKKIKKHILKEMSVNEANIRKAYEVGELTVRDLKGCYTVQKRTAFIRLTNSKKDLKNE